MRVGLIGFGKTGRAVANVLLESKKTSLEWVLRQTTEQHQQRAADCLGIESDEPGLIFSHQDVDASELLAHHPVDVIVDFSSPAGIDFYLDEACKRRITVISAVSHYDESAYAALHQAAEATRVIALPNVTLGINFLICAAKVLKRLAPAADIEIIEEHFKAKPETSGTAIKIAHELALESDSIKTVRAGGIVGVHEILFGFPHQTVRLRHESIAREAFGNGVLFAIGHIPSEASGFFTFDELLMQHFGEVVQLMTCPTQH